jgi:hypothetical protein
MPLAKLHFFIYTFSFWLNALWLAVFYYTSLLFLMKYHFSLMHFFIYINFFRNETRVYNKGCL